MKKILQHIACFWMVTLFGISLLLTGCVKKEVTRIADWETHFTDIYFADAKHGWIVGHQGWVLHTADGGENWEKQTVNTNEDFKAVYFTNLRNGWAVGDKGLIATTDDGGRHWTLQKNQAHTLLLDVFFTNSKTGWITGQDGLLYTKNGGKTWNHQETSEFGLGGTYFVDKYRGWIVGDYDRIFVTTDNSQTWRRQDNLVREDQTTTVCNLHTVFLQTLSRDGVVARMGLFFTPPTAAQNGVHRTVGSRQFMDISAQPSTISISSTMITARQSRRGA